MNRIYFVTIDMMKADFLTFLFVFLPFFAFSFTEDESDKKTDFLYFDGKELLWEGDIDTVQFGNCYSNSGCTHTLMVKNESEVTLWITNVRGSCGLSVPAWPREKIASGETGIIQIRFNGQQPGKFYRNLTIHSNTFSGSTVIKVAGQVIQGP